MELLNWVTVSYYTSVFFLSLSGTTAQIGPGPPLFLRFLDPIQWRFAVGRTPLDEGPAHRRNLYLTTLNTHKKHTRWFKYDRDKLWLVYTQIVLVIFEPPCTSMLPVRLEPAIPASDRPQNFVLDRSLWSAYICYGFLIFVVKVAVFCSGIILPAFPSNRSSGLAL